MNDHPCPSCGTDPGLRDGLCLSCWYASEGRPKTVRDRFAKLERLREAGFPPYGYGFDRSHELDEARAQFEAAESSPEDGGEVRVAGRLLSYRNLGGSAFAHLGDRSGRLQIHLKRNLLGEGGSSLMDLLDLGDWVGVSGTMFRTRRGEVTVRAKELILLAKSIRPLPYGKEEVAEDGTRVVHSGFADRASRYRQRYADLAVNPEIREDFRIRSRVVSALRRWLDERDFLEVETPVLQPLYGGALARPFVTEHHTLGATMYLRIATELYLKRLIVGNLDRVYEIGPDFRNEGVDRTHNPEFTMLELYYAFADYRDVMELTEQMVSDVAQEVMGTTSFTFDGREVELAAPWERLDWTTAFEDATGLNPLEGEIDRLRACARKAGREDAGELSRVQLLDAIFGHYVEQHLVDPVFVCDQPIEMSPLAKPKRGNPALGERFEAVVCGFELVNAFSELNDPVDQWERFAAQARLRAEGDEDAMQIDEDYVRALEYGLPPTGGFGMGVDRLVMLFTGRTSIRDVVLFPMLRPQE